MPSVLKLKTRRFLGLPQFILIRNIIGKFKNAFAMNEMNKIEIKIEHNNSLATRRGYSFFRNL